MFILEYTDWRSARSGKKNVAVCVTSKPVADDFSFHTPDAPGLVVLKISCGTQIHCNLYIYIFSLRQIIDSFLNHLQIPGGYVQNERGHTTFPRNQSRTGSTFLLYQLFLFGSTDFKPFTNPFMYNLSPYWSSIECLVLETCRSVTLIITCPLQQSCALWNGHSLSSLQMKDSNAAHLRSCFGVLN